jgi:esterase/lipase superfamily enzyme
MVLFIGLVASFILSVEVCAQGQDRTVAFVRQFLTDKNIKSSADLEIVLKRLIADGQITEADAKKIREQFKTVAALSNADLMSIVNLNISPERIGDLSRIANADPQLNQMNLDPTFKPLSEIMGKQSVLFATNRKVKVGEFNAAAMTYERTEQTTFGEAIVSVPKAHRIGMTERPGKYFYFWKQAEDQGKHFVIQTFGALSENDFTNRLAQGGDATLVFVHGYNVTFEDSIFKAAQIAFDSNFDGPVLAFSWPSAGSLLGYVHDRDSARQAAPIFVGLLRKAKKIAPNRKIVIVAHSLGSDVVTEALVQANLSGEKFEIAELVLAAPDVDKDLFKQRARQIRQSVGNVTIYASSADKALMASGEGAWVSRIGFVEATGPHLVEGVEVIDVTAVGDTLLELNHGTYSGNRSVLDDVGRIIKTGLRPPHVRSPTLRRMPNSDLVQYWMYPQ